ncbi:MAG: cell division transport system permease protein [Actinomycetota bacterium]|jgi:cell division transport system permease protein|nr:cell division transport system permease protein [Actinomycetota bacterium]
MAISVDYVVRETFTNLRRNLLMTTAAVLTVAVSLSLVGGALLLQQAVNKATVQWRGGVELNIFLNPDVAANQREALQTELENMPQVKKVTYVDQDAAFNEFKQMFANSPDMVESVTPKDLPPSFRVVPRQPELVDAVGERFTKREGVKEVVYARETVQTLIRVTFYLKWGIAVIAGVLLLSAALLILNTIRMAIFARRREVAVMKLVGATNWFIRVPFMLEGMIQGLVGAAGAFIAIWFGRTVIERLIQGNTLLSQFVVSGGDVLGTGIFILVVGALVGGVGSAIAVSRFLDV